MSAAQGLAAPPADWDATFRRTLHEVLARGHDMCVRSSLSIGNEKAARELLNHSLELPVPGDRLLFDPRCRLNLLRAAGRFCWMMAANDRVADVAWYDGGAALFSDDGWTVPGSSDGARLFNPRPGLNQIERVIELLRREPDSRRAVAVIYQPDDAGRVSRDIPCTIGMSYNLRAGGLHATTIMRSSNAFRILPYDLFLFSLLAEVVAAELGVDLAGYHQFAVSFHVYHRDLELAADVAAGEPTGPRAVMPPMPRGPALEHIRALLRIEQDLRDAAVSLEPDSVRRLADRIERELPGYWQDFGRVLLLHAMRRRLPVGPERHDLELAVIGELGAAFRTLVDSPAPVAA